MKGKKKEPNSCINCASFVLDNKTECSGMPVKQWNALFDRWDETSDEDLEEFLADNCGKWSKRED